MNDGYIDIQALMDDDKTPWSDFWDTKKTPYDNLNLITSQALLLPEPEIQMPVLLVYMWVNSKWCTRLPLCLNYGPPGTGKSTAAKLAASLHGGRLESAETTFAAMRNNMDKGRWLQGVSGGRERDGAGMFIDNVDASTFEDTRKRSLMLMGYDRDTDLVSHAGGENGENVEFRCFGMKMLSSVHEIYSYPSLTEMKRRTIVIFHKPDNTFEGELLEPSDISWKDFYLKVYWPFYQDKGRVEAFLKARKSAAHLSYDMNVWNPASKQLMRDLIATGVIMGAWPDAKTGVEALTAYMAYLNDKVHKTKGDFAQFVDEWLESRKVFTHKEIVSYVSTLVRDEKIIQGKKGRDLGDYLKTRGYSKTKDVWSSGL